MKRGVLAAFVAVVLALVGCAAVLLYAHGADKRALAGQKAVRVLVARKDIPAGTTGQAIRDGRYAEEVTMPAAAVPPDALAAIDDSLLTLAVTADEQPRQLLLRGAFGAPAPNRGGLKIPDGMLAVSVAMRVPAQVAGYVQPGAAVAVFDTFNVAEGKGPAPVPAGDGMASNHGYDQATRLLLPKVQVLAVGPRSPDKASGSSGSGGGLTGGSAPADGQSVLVTVAVDQDQAQRLVLAAQTGSLYLALLGDRTDPRAGTGTDNYALFP
jgi:pilus assembly protein CpaB